MPDAYGDRATHDQHVDWTARKRTALRRPTLDCGHANRGEVLYHAWCDRLSCSDECANGPHDCSAFAGVKSGSEERPEPVEPGRRAPGCVCPEDMPENQYMPGCPSCEAFVSAMFAPLHAEMLHHGSAPTCRGCGTPYRMQIGRDLCSACLLQPPAHDRVADAMRAEVLRQGLTECEIDGVRQQYRDGEWTVIDETHQFRLDNSSATFTPDRRIRVSVEGEEPREVSVRPWPEPVAPHVDESRPFLTTALDSEADATRDRIIARIGEVHGMVDDQAVTVDRLRAAISESQAAFPTKAAKTPWWSRLFPGRSTR